MPEIWELALTLEGEDALDDTSSAFAKAARVRYTKALALLTMVPHYPGCEAV